MITIAVITVKLVLWLAAMAWLLFGVFMLTFSLTN